MICFAWTEKWPLQNIKMLLCTIFVIVLCLSCANLKPVKQLSQFLSLDKTKTYVYGRFYYSSDSANFSRIMLRLSNVNTGEDTEIVFKKGDKAPLIFQLLPGDYFITEWLFTKGGPISTLSDGDISSKPIPEDSRIPTKVVSMQPAKAYYLGDYNGRTQRVGRDSRVERSVSGGTRYIVTHMFKGSLISCKDNFSETTKEIKERYQATGTLIFVNLFN